LPRKAGATASHGAGACAGNDPGSGVAWARMAKPRPDQKDHRRGLHPRHGQSAQLGILPKRKILQYLGVGTSSTMSEVLTPADELHHIDKATRSLPRLYAAPAIWAKPCGASPKAAAMIRTKGEAGTGDVVHAVESTCGKS